MRTNKLIPVLQAVRAAGFTASPASVGRWIRRGKNGKTLRCIQRHGISFCTIADVAEFMQAEPRKFTIRQIVDMVVRHYRRRFGELPSAKRFTHVWRCELQLAVELDGAVCEKTTIRDALKHCPLPTITCVACHKKCGTASLVKRCVFRFGDSFLCVETVSFCSSLCSESFVSYQEYQSWKAREDQTLRQMQASLLLLREALKSQNAESRPLPTSQNSCPL